MDYSGTIDVIILRTLVTQLTFHDIKSELPCCIVYASQLADMQRTGHSIACIVCIVIQWYGWLEVANLLKWPLDG